MFLDLDPADDAPGLGVDHGHGRLGPEGDVEPLPRFVEQACPGMRGIGDDPLEEHVGPLRDRGVVDRRWKRGGRRRDLGAEEELVDDRGFIGHDESHARDRMPPNIGGVERGRGRVDGDPGGDAAELLVAERHRFEGHKRPRFESEGEKRLGRSPRHPELTPRGVEGEPLEGLVDAGP
jgi:hypothetical protein